MATRRTRVFGHTLRVFLGALALSAAMARPASAEDASTAVQELSSSSDFRIRVNAALVLGRSGDPEAAEVLEHALGDAHPAVRIAVATALGYVGDPRAIPLLERRLSGEASAGVAAQIRASVDRLRHASLAAAPAAAPVRFLVRLGAMRNSTGSRGDDLLPTLREAARSRAKTLKDTVVVDDDSAIPRQASTHRLPIVTLDASLTQLIESRVGGVLQVQVRVEFTVRRDQTLRGTLSGAATTTGSGQFITEQARRRLQEDAVAGAVQSALRGAEQGLVIAAR